MSLSDFAVRRPITILMAILAVLTFGFLAAQRLPVNLLPDLSYPTLTVQTTYQDAAPLSVEQYVTRPIENVVGVIPGVREMRSTSRPGLSEVSLEFDWGEDMDLMALEVREKLGLAQLPREVETPRVLRFDPSLDPIIRLAFSGDRPLDELRQLSERWLRPKLEAVDGIAAARIRGGLIPEIVVDADEDRLAAFGMTLEDLATALRAENVNQPGGMLKDFSAVYLIRTLHEFVDLDQARRTVIRETETGRVRVEDVARVYRGHRDREEISRVDGQEVVEIALHRAGAANTVAAAAQARTAIEKIRAELPKDLALQLLTDQSRYITAAVDQVWSAALIGGLLAILVLYFFLGDPRATLLIALTIPVSVIATFLPMFQAKVTLNIMSLGGLALGVGMLVDNAIVVLEAIDRRRGQGLSRREAALRGARDVAGAVTASTLTTVAVFFPIVFVQGVAGQLFYDQAVTVCASLLTSLVVSLTLIPAAAAFDSPLATARASQTLFTWDRPGGEGMQRPPFSFQLAGLVLHPLGNGRHWFSKTMTVLFFPIRLVLLLLFLVAAFGARLLETGFKLITWPLDRAHRQVQAHYPGVLRGALRHTWRVVGVAVLLFAASLAILPRLDTELVPDLSQGEFAFQLTFPEGSPLETTAETVIRVEAPLIESGLFERVVTTIGSLPSSASERRTRGENLAQISLTLPEGSEGTDEDRAVARVRRILRIFPRVEAELVRPSVLTVQPPLVLQIFADDLTALREASETVRQALIQLPGVQDVTTTTEDGNPEIQVALDRERAGALGLTAQRVGEALRAQIRGEVVGQFREGEERLDIRLRAAARHRNKATKVAALNIRLPEGGVVPISAVADVRMARGPAAIHRLGGARVALITAAIPSGNLDQVLAETRAFLPSLVLPPEATVALAGQQNEIALSFASLRLAMALAIFLVYGVMAAQFESLLHPLVILTAVPMGLTGIVAALVLTGTTVSVLVMIGAVMLAGIVVNNAIVLVDAINRRRREGQPLEQAVVGAGQERLRPILITTATTVLGLLPMALGLGAGDELRAPLAVTVIGGLTVATLLTLVVVPCLYQGVSRRWSFIPGQPTQAAPSRPGDLSLSLPFQRPSDADVSIGRSRATSGPEAPSAPPVPPGSGPLQEDPS